MRAAQAQVTQADVDSFTEGLPTSDFFGQNLLTDQAVSALEYIFGDVINVVAGLPPSEGLSLGTPDTPFAAMIGMMNTGLLFLGAVYLAWVTLTGVLYSADKGEIFGGKWSVVWMPLKTTLGVSAIFPAVYGYSWLQFFVFWVLLQGIGLGNAVMAKGFDMFKSNREFSRIEPVPPDLIAAGYDLLRSSYCAQAFNQLGPDAVAAVLRDGDVPDPPQRTDNVIIWNDEQRREAVEDRKREAETRQQIQTVIQKINAHPILGRLDKDLVRSSIEDYGGMRNFLYSAGDNIDDALDTLASYVTSVFNTGSSGAPGPLLTMGLIKVDEESNEQELIERAVSGEIYKTRHYFWGTPRADSKASIEAVNDSKVNSPARMDYCGHLSYKRIVGYHLSETKLVTEKKYYGPFGAAVDVERREELTEEELLRAKLNQQQAAGMFGLADDDQSIPVQEFNALHEWVEAIDLIGSNLAKLHSLYPQNVPNFGQHEQGNGEPTKEQLKTIINKFMEKTKTYAVSRQAIDQEYVNKYITKREQSLEEYYWDNFTANLKRDGFLAFGSYYVELSEARANARARLTPTIHYEQTDPDVWKSFQLYSKTGDIKIPALSDGQALELFRYFKGYQDFNNQMQTYTGVMDRETLVPGAAGYGYENQSYQNRRDRYVEEDIALDDEYSDNELEEIFLKLSEMAAGFIDDFIGSGKLQAVEGPPPLLRIREMGEGFLAMSGKLLGITIPSSIGAIALTYIPGVSKIIGSALSGLAAIAFTLVFWLFLLGGFLAVYLPMVPFLVWVGAVVGYFLLAIESIIAAPLWAIAFMEPGTQDGPGGKNAQGWYLVMNLFLRPVLLVVAMIAVMLLADVVLRYLNIYMLPTFQMATTGGSVYTQLLIFIWTTIIYCVFMLTTMHGVYSLIHRIPDNIMEWLGVGVRGLGDTSDERDVRALVMANLQRVRTPSTHGMQTLMGDKGKTPKGPEKEGGPAVSSRD